ncbi:LamG domain-containing protein [Sedimentisphaera salicampi]|uniref:LamG-like jellyroll fold domain-containing protein n=1 Tax=Sedimentisphaera salicampi TaxID=1941349 RepID=A0A1W6LNW0_9BACT|nr:LamG domain-containing protein [Sedimentisphaera salicampi]ARN57478.1 hypothetical protein STSP1_01888 [Sedimentisphaera salicampi]
MKIHTVIIVLVFQQFAAAGSWQINKNFTNPEDAAVLSGYEITAVNVGNPGNSPPDAVDVEVQGFSYDNSNAGLSGMDNYGDKYSEGGVYYTGDNQDLFNLLNTYAIGHDYQDMKINFSNLPVGFELKVRIFLAWPWNWCKFSVTGAEGEKNNIKWSDGDNSNSIITAEYSWVPDSPNAEISAVSEKSGKPFYLMGYALISEQHLSASRAPFPRDGGFLSSCEEDSLSWIPGINSAGQILYIGESQESVEQAVNSSEDVQAFNLGPLVKDFDISELLCSGKQYFWRVDTETDKQNIIKGDVWSFSLSEEIEIEQCPAADMFTSSSISLSNDSDIWHNPEGGESSLKIDYQLDSAEFGGFMEYTFDKPVNLGIFQSSVFNFEILCAEESEPAKLKAVFTDSNNESEEILLLNDVSQLPHWRWSPQRIVLSSLSEDIDVSSIVSFAFYLENIANSPANSSGSLWLDDFYLMPSVYIEEKFPQDLNLDRRIDLKDFAKMVFDYDTGGHWVYSSPPPESSGTLEIHYKFDGQGQLVQDSSGNGRDVICQEIVRDYNDSWAKSDENVGCVYLDGTYSISFFDWGGDQAGSITGGASGFTVAFWFKGERDFLEKMCVSNGAYKQDKLERIMFPGNEGNIAFGKACLKAAPQDWSERWHHLAFVFEKSEKTLNIFLDGVLKVAQQKEKIPSGFNLWRGFKLGKDPDLGFYKGKIDELRIYSTALTHQQILSLTSWTGTNSALQPPEGDINGDGVCDYHDLLGLAAIWLESDLTWP